MVCGRMCNPWGVGPCRACAPRHAPARSPTPTQAGCPRASRILECGSQAFSRTSAWVNGRRILTIATDPACQTGTSRRTSGLSAGTMQVLCEILTRAHRANSSTSTIGTTRSARSGATTRSSSCSRRASSTSRDKSRTCDRLPPESQGIRATLPGAQTTRPVSTPRRTTTRASRCTTRSPSAQRIRRASASGSYRYRSSAILRPGIRRPGRRRPSRRRQNGNLRDHQRDRDGQSHLPARGFGSQLRITKGKDTKS